MSIGPQIILTGKADKILWVYYGILGIIVLLLIYLMGRSVGRKKAGAALQDEIKPANLTFQLSQYQIFADKLYSAMFRTGTDEEAIYAVFRKMVTADDVKQLIVAFGSRRQELTTGGSTLSEWLTSELNDAETGEVNKILQTRNINFSF